MKESVKQFAKSVYDATFNATLAGRPRRNSDETERLAQKAAIRESVLQAMKNDPTAEPADIWDAIYEIHVHHKSGIDKAETIAKVISADQSWKKSSGHAFEEMVKILANKALAGTDIEVVLQRDLTLLLKAGNLANEPRDIKWLQEMIKGNVFDLYAVFGAGEKRTCFGCIQSKTSVRDRVARDREPSIKAMEEYFWSIAVVLDGDFLKMPKFKGMVNGGTTEYAQNGWHGLYVFSDKCKDDRIYPIHTDFAAFADHAKQAEDMWRTQRQWLRNEWKAQ